MKSIKFKIVVSLILLIFFSISMGRDIRVKLTSGGTIDEQQKIEKILTSVLTACYNYYHNESPLGSISAYFQKNVFSDFKAEIHKKQFYPAKQLYSSLLIRSQNGDYEVFGLNMKLASANSDITIPHKHITFTLNENFLIKRFFFTPEKHHYQDVLEFGNHYYGLKIRNKIHQLINDLETAIELKNINFFKTVFSNEIIIITGFIPTNRMDTARYQTQYIHQPCENYISRLGELMDINDSISVNFDKIKIFKHPYALKIYGVEAEQTWRTDHYYDTGYLFLMIDFFDQNNPRVHVRIWQPHPFTIK